MLREAIVGIGCRVRLGVAVCAVVLSMVAMFGVFVGVADAALGEGRAYEQVSPEFKAGYPVVQPVGTAEHSALAVDGEAVKFSSIGAFNGSAQDFSANPYLSRRTADGWVTEALDPSFGGEECIEFIGGPPVFSADLSRFEFVARLGASAEVCEVSPTTTLWVRQPDGSLTHASPQMTITSGPHVSTSVGGASADLSRAVIERVDDPGAHIVPGDETEAGLQLFEAEGSSLRLVALDNSGHQLTRSCDIGLGSGRGVYSQLGAVSQPGASEIFFSVLCGEEQLFVRVNGKTTIEVSKPLSEECSEVPCPGAGARAPARFQGASEDGSKVFFTTTERLVEGDKDLSNNLYVATIGCAGGGEGEACGSATRKVTSLALVSSDSITGQAAEVEPDIVAVSSDGSHAYFVAQGVLSETANGEGETAAAGAENLYVYDATSSPGKVSFIADLCSGPERSGRVSDGHCPSSLDESVGNGSRNDRGLWLATEFREAQTTRHGGFLVFGTFAQLIRSGPEADTDAAEDVYRYDAQTGDLQRVSIGEASFDANGNNSLFDAHITRTTFRGPLQEQYELLSRAITEDGSKVVFTTSEPLSPRAINGQSDVYLWSEGRVAMISSGSASEADEQPVISPLGRDLLFRTNVGLVPLDTDGLGDLYDARIGGGFPLPEAPREPCSGDACQGPLSTPASVLVPGSISQPAGGNLASPAATKAKAVKKAKARKRKKHKAKARRSGRAHTSARLAVRGRRGR